MKNIKFVIYKINKGYRKYQIIRLIGLLLLFNQENGQLDFIYKIYKDLLL